MYCSDEVIQIFQDDPLEWRPSSFSLNSWTDTIAGYLAAAKEYSMCLWQNRKLMNGDYTWEVTINIEQELHPKDIKAVWNKIKDQLCDRGIVAFWVREPTTNNRCHYHLLLRNQIAERELRKVIRESLPDRRELPTHTHVERIRNQWNYVWYITKGKVRTVRNGREIADKHAKKRLLFAPKLGFRKVGTIGDFWVKSRGAIWQDICDREKQIADGLEQPNIGSLVDHVYEWFGATIKRRRIERSFGYSADKPAIRDWAQQVASEEQTSEEDQQLGTDGVHDRGSSGQKVQNIERRSFTPLWTAIVAPLGRALAWCCKLLKPRPDPLLSHPP